MEKDKKAISNEDLKLQNNSFDLYEGGGNYINLIRIYHAYFNKISNIKTIANIDITRMRQWIVTEMKESIIKEHYNQVYNFKKKKNFYEDHFLFLSNKIVINIFGNNVCIVFDPVLENEANDLQNQ